MSACLAHLAGLTGHVLALEKQPKLVQRAQASIEASLPDLLSVVDVRVCNVMAGGRDWGCLRPEVCLTVSKG